MLDYEPAPAIFARYTLGQVETYLLDDPRHRAFVLEHLGELVVKPVGESGGNGMLVGPHSTAEQQKEMLDRIVADPRNYIAQPTLALSAAPCLVADGVEPRHVDLRPYVLCGQSITVVPGGLTRVALQRGSLVVNSSLACALTSPADSAQSGGADPVAGVSDIEAECDRVHRAVHETYIDHRRPAAPVASEEAPWTTR